jgi:succinate-semialdehyde dehydrogenase / glutarate-semialdehyde dehydrogenase
MPLQSHNPAIGETVKTFTELSDVELEVKLAASAQAFTAWKQTTFEQRAALMKKMAAYLREKSADLGALMTLEMGKTITAATAEVEKCALVCDYYADNAATMLAHEPLSVGATESYVQFDPLGPVLAVMPWNFPYWQVYRFAAPALMAGNVGLLKHASNVPQCAESIEAAFRACGFPDGAFQNLLIGSSRVERVIRDPRIVAVTLTGSEAAGMSVARIAGEELKKTVLELGGSDPFIVLDDADIALACDAAAIARMQNNAGQSCIAAKRFIVHASVHHAFVSGLAERFKALVIGDPTQSSTQVGPLASAQMLQDITRQVDASVAKGAVIVTGGKRYGDKGYFYEPTILDNVTKGMPAYDEEVFGPVAAVITVQNDEEAIVVANDTPYGLGASLCTSDMARAKRLIPQIESGNVFVNGPVKSDSRAPFGGIKKSGYGRELSSYGIKEFVNIKNVWMK